MRFLPVLSSFLILIVTLGLATVFVGGTTGCSSYRTEALQRRQGFYNERSSARDQRRAIRAENMDARTGFDLPDM